MTTKRLENDLLQDVVRDADFAFWEVVAERYPLARSGDLSIGMTFDFRRITQEAVEEWVNNNVEVPRGYRFALRRDVDRFPDFVAKQGMTGTVTNVDDDGLISAKMDEHIRGAEQWDNELCWDNGSAAFLDDTVPIAPDSQLDQLFAYLDKTCVLLQKFGCYAALSEDKTAIFECPIQIDGTPERDSDDPSHMNWNEVTAPEPDFLKRVNEAFGTSFDSERFPGR